MPVVDPLEDGRSKSSQNDITVAEVVAGEQASLVAASVSQEQSVMNAQKRLHLLLFSYAADFCDRGVWTPLGHGFAFGIPEEPVLGDVGVLSCPVSDGAFRYEIAPSTSSGGPIQIVRYEKGGQPPRTPIEPGNSSYEEALLTIASSIPSEVTRDTIYQKVRFDHSLRAFKEFWRAQSTHRTIPRYGLTVASSKGRLSVRLPANGNPFYYFALLSDGSLLCHPREGENRWARLDDAATDVFMDAMERYLDMKAIAEAEALARSEGGVSEALAVRRNAGAAAAVGPALGEEGGVAVDSWDDFQMKIGRNREVAAAAPPSTPLSALPASATSPVLPPRVVSTGGAVVAAESAAASVASGSTSSSTSVAAPAYGSRTVGAGHSDVRLGPPAPIVLPAPQPLVTSAVPPPPPGMARPLPPPPPAVPSPAAASAATEGRGAAVAVSWSISHQPPLELPPAPPLNPTADPRQPPRNTSSSSSSDRATGAEPTLKPPKTQGILAWIVAKINQFVNWVKSLFTSGPKTKAPRRDTTVKGSSALSNSDGGGGGGSRRHLVRHTHGHGTTRATPRKHPSPSALLASRQEPDPSTSSYRDGKSLKQK